MFAAMCAGLGFAWYWERRNKREHKPLDLWSWLPILIGVSLGSLTSGLTTGRWASVLLTAVFMMVDYALVLMLFHWLRQRAMHRSGPPVS